MKDAREKETLVKLRSLAASIAALTIAGAGVAWGTPDVDGPHQADTVLVEGYDFDTFTLLYGTSSSTEDPYDCRREGDHLYQRDGGTVSSLTDAGGEPVEFPPSGNDEAGTDPLPYSGDGPCALSAVDVAGPNGQVNHGQVVSSFVHALKEAGVRAKGCLVRTIATSDYGKGDQQSSVGDEISGDVEGDRPITLAAHEARCGKGADRPTPPGQAKEKPEKAAEKPPKSEHPGHGRDR